VFYKGSVIYILPLFSFYSKVHHLKLQYGYHIIKQDYKRKRYIHTIMTTVACSNLKCNCWNKELREKRTGYGFKISKITCLTKPRRNKFDIPMFLQCKRTQRNITSVAPSL